MGVHRGGFQLSHQGALLRGEKLEWSVFERGYDGSPRVFLTFSMNWRSNFSLIEVRIIERVVPNYVNCIKTLQICLVLRWFLPILNYTFMNQLITYVLKFLTLFS